MTKTDDTLSRQIGSVLGPLLVVVTISEAINLGIWAENNPTLNYLNRMLLFAGGLAIVRFHFRWRPLWAVSITVMGVLLLVGGTMRLFFPTTEQAPESAMTYVFVGVLCTIGLIMSLGAYWPAKSKS